MEFLGWRQVISSPYANKSYQPRPNNTATGRCNLVIFTRPNREKLSQHRKVDIRPFPKATQRNWFITLKAKEAKTAASIQAPAPTQPADAPADQSPNLPYILK